MFVNFITNLVEIQLKKSDNLFALFVAGKVAYKIAKAVTLRNSPKYQ